MNNQFGSALSETLVALLVLLPAWWAIEYLGGLHDVQRAAVASARYLAWEATEDGTGMLENHPSIIQEVQLSEPTEPPVITKHKLGGRSALPSRGYAVAAIAHGDWIPVAARLGGLSSNMLGQPQEDLWRHRIQIDIKEQSPREPSLSFIEQATVSMGDWQSQSDEEYQRRTESIVASEPVHWVSQPAQQLGRFFVFREGRYASSTDFIPPSNITPR